MRRLSAVLIILCIFIVGCGSSSSSSSKPRPVTIHTRADTLGVICFKTPVLVGSSLTLKAADGKDVATAETVKTPGTESCDFTTQFDAVPSSAYYNLYDDKGTKIVGFDQADILQGTVELVVDVAGRTSVASGAKASTSTTAVTYPTSDCRAAQAEWKLALTSTAAASSAALAKTLDACISKEDWMAGIESAMGGTMTAIQKSGMESSLTAYCKTDPIHPPCFQ
jgi:hypothetical protein